VKFRSHPEFRARATWICLTVMAFLCRIHGAGVTLVTHGFVGNVTDWVIPMCQQITHTRTFPGTNFTLGQLSVTRSGNGAYAYTYSQIGGVNPLAADSGEILLALDWSTLATGSDSTASVAAEASKALLATNLMPELGGHPLAELPLHFIGHSRGASVITEMARILGSHGIWVDQVTTLDPHPVPEYGDPAITNYANVLYADNYWQSLGGGIFGSPAPTGTPIPGAFNRQLTSLNNGYALAHSDVHLWYHGTIDWATPTSDSTAMITAAMRASWWSAIESRGTNAGYLYSRIAGGNRLSSQEPAGAGKGRISDGLNRIWDFGAGLAANRTGLPIKQDFWPNIPLLTLSATNPIAIGDPISVVCCLQGSNDATANTTIGFFLDRDANPYDGNEIQLMERTIEGAGQTNLVRMAFNPSAEPAVTPIGNYWLGARVSDGNHARFAYAQVRLSFTPARKRPSLQAARLQEGRFGFTISASPGQKIAVDISSNLSQWVPVQTNILSSAVWDFFDSSGPALPGRAYRARVLP